MKHAAAATIARLKGVEAKLRVSLRRQKKKKRHVRCNGGLGCLSNRNGPSLQIAAL